ncbi:MAG: DUF433 domain-containing protein [Candidatus Kapaibacterium sp.]
MVTLNTHIEVSRDIRGGKPCIAGRRITVADIAVRYEWFGESPDEIAAEYNLTLSEIYAALSYYHDHQNEIDASIHESQEFADNLRVRFPSKLSRQ